MLRLTSVDLQERSEPVYLSTDRVLGRIGSDRERIPQLMFDIVDVSTWSIADAVEPIGTRPKWWLRDEEGDLWLFKEARSDAERPSGQDWAEKAVAEMAILLGIPAAIVELAHWKGARGIVSRNFVPRGSTLVHGNELLSAKFPEYPQDQLKNDTAGYTVEAIREVLFPYEGPHAWANSEGSGFDCFFGYLILDAWVNNTDRHHRNWGVIVSETGSLAPSFDHGSSLAFGETDANRARILRGGADAVEGWLTGGRTRSFEGMPSMIEVVLAALESDPSLRRDGWIDRLESITFDEVEAVLNKLPEEGPSGVILSDTSRTLCSEILRINRMRLLDAVATY